MLEVRIRVSSLQVFICAFPAATHKVPSRRLKKFSVPLTTDRNWQLLADELSLRIIEPIPIFSLGGSQE
jgi:hypothetical protein